MRSMIVNLRGTLPAQRQAALNKELELLDRTIDRLYVLPEDLHLAKIPDSQGLGGASHFKTSETSVMRPKSNIGSPHTAVT
jgi:hypothetical protein